MSSVLVTGASGLVGANVCLQLVERGHHARALVRSMEGTEPLAALGAELVLGDVTDVESLRTAGTGVDGVIHSAALIGGPGQDRDAFWAVNAVGSRNVLNIAPGGKTVIIGTAEMYAGVEETITEKTPLPDNGPQDPYAAAKRDALEAGLELAAKGQQVVAVLPGGIYGPSPMVQRSFSTNSYNRVIRGGIRGKLPQYVAFPAPWVYSIDVATTVVRSFEDGTSGEVYLAFGRPEDVLTTAGLINVASEIAGVDTRSEDLTINDGNRADIERMFGPSLVELADREFPEPFFDDTYTRTALGVSPTPLREGLTTFIDWMRREAQL